MRDFSSVVSITGHVALGAAVLFGTAKTGRSDPARPHEVPIIFQPIEHQHQQGEGLVVVDPQPIVPPDFRSIPIPMTLPKTGALIPTFWPVYSGGVSSTNTGRPPSGGLGSLLAEEHAEVLTGPLPVYPDLLRQAGVQGRVVLEAVVDTTGRVLSQSIAVVSATNPGFVVPARRALLATLFRPAMVGAKAVPMLVRIPYEFAIRNGTGRAR
jgi:protein TonB